MGKELHFTVSALDCDDDTLVIKAKGLPSGATLTQAFDTATRKQVATFSWTPSVLDVNTAHKLKFVAVDQDGNGAKSESSEPRWTTVRVWPENTDPDAGAVQTLAIQRAQWQSANSQLVLAGRIKFSKVLTKAEREALVAEPVLIKDEATQAVIGQVNAASNGNWSTALSLDAGAVPCSVIVAFHGEHASRAVKRAPSQCH